MGYGATVEGYPPGFERELAEGAAARGAGQTGEEISERESQNAGRAAAERESEAAIERETENAGQGQGGEGSGGDTGGETGENTDENPGDDAGGGEDKPKEPGDPNAGPSDPTQADPNNPKKSEGNASENDIDAKKEKLEKERETATPERQEEIDILLEKLEEIRKGRLRILAENMLSGGFSAGSFFLDMIKKLFTKDGLKVLLALFIGMEVMIRSQMQTDGECKRLCESRNNPKGTCSDPNIPDAVCPTTTEDCGKYCDTACSTENRLARAEQRALDNPMGTALDSIGSAIDNAVNAPLQLWDTFKYIFIGIGVILLLAIVYKFSTAWVSGKAASMTIMGATRGSSGITDADVQNYKKMQDNIKAVNSS
uniref:Uncharacterized protein n=1 Tax=viral metagenome TaxID=1070528 RepID=A0A6C0F598_9ZZZZ|tara:strand:- start:6074 stop:7183 length:1110 start_codon:yes stop_codon:yes gene_type:complete